MYHQRATADSVDLTAQLNELMKAAEGVMSVLLFSGDGIALAAADGLSREAVERSSAAFCGMKSLQGNLAEFCHKKPENMTVRVQVTDCGSHSIFLLAAGHNSGLALAVEGEAFGANAQLALSKAVKLANALKPVLAASDRPMQRA